MTWGSRQWWGLKLIYWLILGIAITATLGWYFFKKPKFRKPKKK